MWRRAAARLPAALGRGRRFNVAEAERPRPRPVKRQEAFTAGKVLGVTAVGAGVAYAASETVREEVHRLMSRVNESFEDFNDTSREFFEGIGDRLFARRQEPWLVDLATLKYPEHLPTLVLDVDKVILHLQHDSRQGWQVVKRPFADKFFKEIPHYYEVVLFSDDVFPVALDIATKWNLPVTGVLHREFCKKKRSHFVKDLSKLGRRLDRVLMIDHDPVAFQMQPENGIVIRPFDGDTSDTELADLLEFLKAAASSNMDLRKFLEKYGGGDEDVGRRYLVQKQEQEKLVESRRSFGRAFTPRQGFADRPQPPGFGLR
ncbi:unnamed protein product [Effrenium voratum]|uniref:Mitochondrial import inner membrane translocase subunit TIM50 n=1 Tax=Effrenium voratum TaxID=2562239 RepID=A0AA36NCW0_9DINO|nr:unnamed protein product [Effrenium voratum]CAJ1434998.1 unnamed protein product [Effrenium voratum]